MKYPAGTLFSLIVFLGILIPVIGYLSFGYRFSGPIFYGDDYDLLESMTLFPEAETFSRKVHFWYKQQNDHRILLPRLITFLDYSLEGFINWRNLALIANLIWVFILLLLWKTFRSLNLAAWLFIPVSWVLFQPQYYENIVWPISILQQSNVVVWIALTIYLYGQKRHRLAFLAALAAAFTHGSGISSFLVILVLMALDRQWRYMAYWAAGTGTALLVYFYRYEKGMSSHLQESLSDPLLLIQSFFAFLGSLTRVLAASPYWAVGLGVVLVAIPLIRLLPALLRTLRGTYALSPFEKFLLGNLLALLITAMLVSLTRSWSGLENIMPPRYQHYPAYMACLAYLALISGIPELYKRSLALPVLFTALVFNALSYLTHYPNGAFHHHSLIAEEANYASHKKFLRYHWTFNRNIHTTLEKALAKGTVRSHPRLPVITGQAYPADTTELLDFHADYSSGTFPEAEERWFRIVNSSSVTPELYLYLQPPEGPGYWLAVRKSRPAFRDFLTRGVLLGKGFHAEVPQGNIPAGSYHIGIWKNNRFYRTVYSLQVEKDQVTVVRNG